MGSSVESCGTPILVEAHVMQCYSHQHIAAGHRALLTLRGLRGAPEVPPLCRETQSLGQQMLELSCGNASKSIYCRM